MAQGKFISYLRVSTDKQGRSGLGIEAQREAVASYLNGGRWTLVSEYVETESGRKSDRPKLAAALPKALEAHKVNPLLRAALAKDPPATRREMLSRYAALFARVLDVIATGSAMG